jgi:uncharacterized hydrophobic protein (TIGR00271 family)
MTSPADQNENKLLPIIRGYLQKLFNIEEGTDEAGTIAGIRKDTEFKGINSWILVCSIFIASIGLNTNSTAVIIGAMLISPLMGPILGIGLAIGIFDFDLLKRALKNFGSAVLLAVITSTLYFSITPLGDAQSELLARTTPTIWDVLIAFFGGLAGIVAGSRREKGNVIPGVAIATALMPPLCTAGYGLASGNWSYFLGAFYLFFINSVFIGFATLLIVRLLKFKPVNKVDTAIARRSRQYVTGFVILTMIPSIWIAYGVVQESLFTSRSNAFVRDYVESDARQVIQSSYEMLGDSAKITLAILGEPLSDAEKLRLQSLLQAKAGLHKTRLIILQAGGSEALLDGNKGGLLETLFQNNRDSLEQRKKRLLASEEALAYWQLLPANAQKLGEEVQLLYPMVGKLAWSRVYEVNPSTGVIDTLPVVLIHFTSPATTETKNKIRDWLQLRMQTDSLRLVEY